MGGEADAELRRWQAEFRAHGPAHPGIALCRRRPDPLVEPAQNHAVGMLQAGLQRTPDRKAGMAAVGRADHMVLHQRIEQCWVVRGRRNRWQFRRGLPQRRQEARRLLARLVRPEPRGPRLFVACREPFREPDVGLQKVAQVSVRPPHDGGERRGIRFQPLQPAADVGIALLERRPEAAEAGCRPGPAQDRPLHGPHGTAPCRRCHVASGQRMLEGGEQGDGRCVFGNEARGEPEKGAGPRLAQGDASRIVHRYPPAHELRSDAAGEGAVRRHQGGCAAGGFQRAPHDDGDDARLLLRARAVDAVDIAQRRRVAPRQLAPAGDGFRRPHGVGDQARAGACVSPVPALRPWPGLDGGAHDTDVDEQPFQRVLRMGGADRLPGLVVGLGVEAGENGHALWQTRDGGQQVARGGHAPGGARADHGMSRRLLLPALGEAHQHGVATRPRVHQAPLLQMRRPALHDDREKPKNLLPVGRVFLRRESGQRLRIEAGDLHLVEKGCERARKPGGLIHGAGPGERRAGCGLAELLDQVGELQLALQGCDGVGQRRVILVGDARLVLVDIAEGANTGQQERLPRRLALEGEVKGPAGTSRGQQDREAAQGQGVAPVERDDPAREDTASQRIHEGRGRGHRVEGGRPRPGVGAHPPSPRKLPARCVSAAASPAGEPTWSMRPWCASPKRRPARIASS